MKEEKIITSANEYLMLLAFLIIAIGGIAFSIITKNFGFIILLGINIVSF